MQTYVLGFRDIDRTKHSLVGGKGAHLGELFRIEGLHVPDGFCITTDAYKKVLDDHPSINTLLHELSNLTSRDQHKIKTLGTTIRDIIERTEMPHHVQEAIVHFLTIIGENNHFAVRSSATAEDLPTASFAGQQDTYLNIIGKDAVLAHVRKCWASLYTERAIAYRIQNAIDHRNVHMSVVVQQMVFPQASGILFTADPTTSNRKVLSIEASFGLGEALVSGLVNPDIYKVGNGTILEKKISTKKLAIHALTTGGTQETPIESDRQNMQTLTDEQVLRLTGVARQIETHFQCPQDIEWCLADDTFYVLQSRRITTLFPIPVAPNTSANDHANRVFVSVGHQQMMTDPLRPLGLSFFLLTTRAPMSTAGGRLFVDVTNGLASPVSRENLLDVLGQSDPLIKDALQHVLQRTDFIKPQADHGMLSHIKSAKGMTSAEIQRQAGSDPGTAADLIQQSEAMIEELKRKIQTKSGTDLFDFIANDLQNKKNVFDQKSLSVIMAAINASFWLNEKMFEWLGERNVADTLSLSAPNNITSEMGMALLDVADVFRPYPEVIEYIQTIKDNDSLDKLRSLRGGVQCLDALDSFLIKYGMRCAGEIDITRTRWIEKPAMLIPIIVSNIKNVEPGMSRRKFEQGREEAARKERSLLERLRQLPQGYEKANETKPMIDVVRNFIGYREYPKFALVNRYFLYKQALMREAEKLVQSNVIQEREDIYYLNFEELRQAVSTHQTNQHVIDSRKQEYRLFEKLTPPRVITSDGEIIHGAYQHTHLPSQAIAGLAVSSGIVEGRARVILSLEDADIDDGDILITPFTDPSWTPLFVSIKGLVTEVGGLMTHGAVVAREYGLPAIVGVENATKLIRDGQRIRVNGTDGYIEIL